MKYFVFFDEYTEHTQFEGEWNLEVIEFDSLEKANDWLNTSLKAKECRQYDRRLFGPLILFY